MQVLDFTPHQARVLKAKLMNAPVAPGDLAPFINVGTEHLLEVLEQQYFVGELADGISCFKYVEGDYGTGKSQFIHCLALRAQARDIVTAVVTVGHDCPFNSPSAILRSVMAALVPPTAQGWSGAEGKGIELLVRAWIHRRLREMGVTPGNHVPDPVAHELRRPFEGMWLGAPDTQMGAALLALGRRLLALECGAAPASTDQELVAWIRGDNVRSTGLKNQLSLFEPTNDTTAFQRLKTVVAFMRERLNYRGFLIAFDEGTRIMSFRRGTARQRQAIENMLTMINQNAEGEFGGVMFVYAATPEFRSEVIQNTYIALRDRIGSVAFAPGRPMTPFISLDNLNSDATLLQLADRLMDVFEVAEGVSWDRSLQRENAEILIEEQKRRLAFPTTVPPRYFVFHWCRLLAEQLSRQMPVDLAGAGEFIEKNVLPDEEG